MPITIEGAFRHKKLYIGKQVRLLNVATGVECMAKIMEIQRELMFLELGATGDYSHLGLLPEEQLTVTFVVPDDATYSLSAKVISFNDSAQLLQLVQEAPLTRTEKRRDYRLRTVKLIYVAMHEQSVWESWQQASLLDISRNGASILTALPVSQGDELKVWIPLEEVDHILEAGTRVVRVLAGEADQLIIGLSFNELSLANQEKILDYILKEWLGENIP